MSYVDIVYYIGSLPILETWPPIYRGQERTVRDRLKANQVYSYVYFRYTPCLTDFTFEFIWRPTPPILSPSYWTFVELTLVNWRRPWGLWALESWIRRLFRLWPTATQKSTKSRYPSEPSIFNLTSQVSCKYSRAWIKIWIWRSEVQTFASDH
jgi:hypothetical protein